MSVLFCLGGFLSACVYSFLVLRIPRTVGVLTLLAFAVIVWNEAVGGSVSNVLWASLCGLMWSAVPFLFASLPRWDIATKKD